VISTVIPVLLESALRALLAALVLMAGLRLFRVVNVLALKGAWGLVLLAALAMPMLMRTPWLPAWAAIRLPAPSWPRMLDAAPAATSASPVSPILDSATVARPASAAPVPYSDPDFRDLRFSNSQLDAQVQNAPASAPIFAATPASRAGTPPARITPYRLLTLGWLLYLAVGAALLLRLLFGLASSIRLWMEAKPVEAAPEFDLPAAIPVRSSRRVASPVNIGSGILLPADYSSWDREKLRVVLAHEGSHVRQRDFYLQLLAGLYAALTWFSPLGWWLKRKLSELGEAISDRAGLEQAASRSAYAQLLLEFAVLPRPTLTGVAMAHSTNLSERIERLLNDSSFRQAFAGSRRALLALALVPGALFAATTLVRVEAAQLPQQTNTPPAGAPQAGAPQAAQAPDQPSYAGQSNPAPIASQDQAPPSAAPQPNPAPAPAGPPSQDIAPLPPLPPITVRLPNPDAISVVVPIPPMPQAPADAAPSEPPVPPMPGEFEFHMDADRYEGGDAYAIVGGTGNNVRSSGDWDGKLDAEVEKARRTAHGDFLLFRHDGKSYIVDDPATVAQVEEMNKQLQELGEKMRTFGKQERDLGQQARDAGHMARDATASIPKPDLTKEMANLNAAVASLQAAQKTVSREQLAQVERSIAEMQRQLISAQLRVDVNLDPAMIKLREEQGKFGSEMGKMGAEMGRTARENDRKTRGIIDQSLKDGKARPIQ
jgi:beta-lactamase regulating signal transducer with metallopeptidase domain